MNHTVCKGCNRNWLFHNEELCIDCSKKISSFKFILSTAMSGDDIDSISNEISERMINNQVKLNDQGIKQVCDAYYLSGEKNSERLDNTNQLFLQLHHNNGMII